MADGFDRVHQLEAFTGTRGDIAYADGYLVATNGAKAWISSGTLTSWTQITGLSGTINRIATDGVTFYIATSANLYTINGGSTAATSLSAGQADNVGFVANRLLVGNANELFEVAAGGARTSIREHFQASFRWTTMFAVGSRIYVGGHAGSRAELYSLTTTDAGALVQSAEAAPLEPAEYLLNAASYAGFVVLITSRGARMAQVGADGTLTYGPVISAGSAGGATANTRRGLAIGNGFAWFMQLDSSNSRSSLIEMDLTRFTDVLTPAYTVVAQHASNTYSYEALVYADATGESKYVVGLDRQNSHIAVYPGEEETVTGYVETGTIRFGTVEAKILTELEVGFDDLPANSTVVAKVYQEDGTLIATGTASTTGQNTLTVDLLNTSSRGCYVRLELTESSAFAKPVVRYWRMLAYPVAPSYRQWMLPIITHEKVVIGSGEGVQQAQNPATIQAAIAALAASKAAVPFVIGDTTYTVRVEEFETTEAKWTSDGKFLQGVLTVRLVSA